MQKTTITMPKRSFDSAQHEINKKDRFERMAEMSQQEMLIQQKKREIQAKWEAKRRLSKLDEKEKQPKPVPVEVPTPPKEPGKEPSTSGINHFSNDGSFMDQFKQLNDKKKDSKFKTFNKYKDKERQREQEEEKERQQEREQEIESDEAQDTIISIDKINYSEPPPITENLHRPPPNFTTEPPPLNIPFNNAFTSPPPSSHFSQPPQMLPPQTQITLDTQPPQIINQQANTQISSLINIPAQISFAPPENLSFTSPPHQLAISHINTNIAPPSAQIITSTVAQQITSPLIQQPINIVAAPGTELVTPTVNLSTPAPVLQQTQTIMTQALAAPHLFATTTAAEQIISAPPQVLLNVPPPQILPQTQLVITPQDQNVLVSAPTSILATVTLPPPVITHHNINVSTPNALNVHPQGIATVELTSIPPPNPIQVQNIPQPEPLNTMNIPPPAPLQVSTIPTPSSLQLNEIPNPKPLDLLAIPTPSELKNIPPPNKNLPPPDITGLGLSRIPSLMSQRVLPPPGMAVNVPPPTMLPRDVSQPPPNFSIQPPMVNLNVPPPMLGAVPLPLRGDDLTGGPEYEAMANLAKMVAECGPSVEDVVRLKKTRDPELWFLFHKESPVYRRYASLVEQYKKERDEKPRLEQLEAIQPDESEMYEPEMALEDDDFELDINEEVKIEVKQEEPSMNTENLRRDRKRKSRWGEKNNDVKPPLALPLIVNPLIPPVPIPGCSTMLTKVTRTDPGLVQYAMQSYGSANLSEEDWKKAEDNYKVHLLYQDMMKKRQEVEKLQMQGRNKYEYDSDEETQGGTWEHKLREKEMQATDRWALELNRQAEGKHHIGDFLPPDEFKRFMEKSNAIKEGRPPNFSDYKEFKLKEDNVGFKMLQKLGWSEGQGLGQNNAGIVEPVNKGAPRENTQGLGLNLNETSEDEDEYDSYRKRMMLAYRFRPNPLNNPRRPYY